MKEMQMQAILVFSFTPVRMAIIEKTNGEDARSREKEPLYTLGGNVN